MDDSNSGIIANDAVRVSDSFSDYTDICTRNHNRLVKAQRFGKWYVLKGLKPEFADKSIFIELLRKEFDLGISLDYPNIVRTIGIENVPQIGDCIVLEYVDGTTLKEWLATNPRKSERKRIAMQLLDAMSYFHSKGVIHRDLKPDNILITHNGTNVKIIDFGLSDSDQYAILKQPVGSCKYSAPEQLQSGTTIDARADIYSFGRILEEFSIYKRVSKRATQKNPDNRYSSAMEITAAIRNRHRARIFIPILLVVVAGIIAFATQTKQPPIQEVTGNKKLAAPILTKAEQLIDSLYLPIIKEWDAVEKIDYKRYSTQQDSISNGQSRIINLLQADMPEELKNDTDFQIVLSAILSKYNDEMMVAMGKLTH